MKKRGFKPVVWWEKLWRGGPFEVSKENLIVVEGKIAVSSFKELAALLWQAKETG